MFYVVVEGGLDGVALEQAAALCALGDGATSSQPAARAWVRSLASAPGALLCVGKEADDILAFAAGAIERDEGGPRFILHELCVSTVRSQCGIGSELLEFTLGQACARGAGSAFAAARLEAKDAAFLQKHGFARAPAESVMRRTLSPPR